jgi:hypothetical protein
MTPYTEEFVDYSTILMKVEQLEKDLHDACLHKHYDKVPHMVDDLIVQALQLKQWVKSQREEKKSPPKGA